MRFDDSALSAALKNRIASHIDSGRFPHACIISGQNEQQIFGLAQNIARALVCSSRDEKPCDRCSHCKKALKSCHPDIITVQPGKNEREIKIDQIRALVRDAVILPNEADSKVYIICHADMMNTAAQNAFLKLLEEPPGYAVFMLLAENPGFLLETVRSRCTRIDVEREAEEKPADESGLAQEYYKVLQSSSELAAVQFSLKLEKLDRQGMIAFTENAAAFLTAQLRADALSGKECQAQDRIIAAIELLRELEDMQDYNVSVGHMAGRLAVETAKIVLK